MLLNAKYGSIGWHDLTVENAKEIKDFYRKVTGWQAEAVDMGGYDDYSMVKPGDGEVVAGICHHRGENADLPPQWLMYITVADIEDSIAACKENGGKLVAGPKNMGDIGKYAIIEDPAGAVCALWEEIEV